MFLFTLLLKSQLNFLAHCYLSCRDEDLMIGNFITDFLKAGEESFFSAEIQMGIQLHRKIDRFTDRHLQSIEVRSLLRKRHGKYASVAVDLLWDYYLCQNWDMFSNQRLRNFVDSNYELILNNHKKLPGRLSVRIHRMIDDDFLMAYVSKERMTSALKWMDQRTSFPSKFIELIKDVEENDMDFSDKFKQFFPDIIEYVEKNCYC